MNPKDIEYFASLYDKRPFPDDCYDDNDQLNAGKAIWRSIGTDEDKFAKLIGDYMNSLAVKQMNLPPDETTVKSRIAKLLSNLPEKLRGMSIFLSSQFEWDGRMGVATLQNLRDFRTGGEIMHLGSTFAVISERTAQWRVFSLDHTSAGYEDRWDGELMVYNDFEVDFTRITIRMS